MCEYHKGMAAIYEASVDVLEFPLNQEGHGLVLQFICNLDLDSILKLWTEVVPSQSPMLKTLAVVISTGMPNQSLTKQQKIKHKGKLDDCHIDYDALQTNTDSRTTLMLRNIPNTMSEKEILDVLQDDTQTRGCFNSFHLPLDKKGMKNQGFAFVNVVDAANVASFYDVMHGRRWNADSEKECHLSYATIQHRNPP